MDLQVEKAAIIKRLEMVNDESLIKTFKSLLDYALKSEEKDKLLESSIDKGLAQSAKEEGRAHDVVMEEMREKYKGVITLDGQRSLKIHLMKTLSTCQNPGI